MNGRLCHMSCLTQKGKKSIFTKWHARENLTCRIILYNTGNANIFRKLILILPCAFLRRYSVWCTENKRKSRLKPAGSHGGCHPNYGLIGFHTLQSEIQDRRQRLQMCSIKRGDHILAGWFTAIQWHLAEEHVCIQNLFMYWYCGCRSIFLNRIYSCILLYYLFTWTKFNHSERDGQHFPPNW